MSEYVIVDRGKGGYRTARHMQDYDPRSSLYIGSVTCARGYNVIYSSCRWLRDMGYTGKVHFITPEGRELMIVKDLVKAAELTAIENRQIGPKIVKYRPPPCLR